MKTENSLKTYLSFTGLALLSGNVSGQMVYTDIIPDVYISPPLFGGIQSYMFDPDQDGVPDFEIKGTSNPNSCYYSSYSTWFVADDRLTFEGLTSGALTRFTGIPGCNIHRRTFAFNAAQLIQFGPSAGGLQLTEIYMTGSCYCNGFTATANDKYFGYRFIKNGVPCIGWIRFSEVNEFLILKDFAYCDGNTSTLPAGTLNYNVGIDEISSAFSIDYSGGQLQVIAPPGMSFQIEIYDLIGKMIDQISCTDGLLNYPFTDKGIFILKVKTAHDNFSRKIFVH